MSKIIPGAYTAMVTPFRADGAIDEAALRRLVDFQIAGGIDGLAVCGCTGEAPTLEGDDIFRVVSLVRGHAVWALSRLAGVARFRAAMRADPDVEVAEEWRLGLAEVSSRPPPSSGA